MIPAVDARVDPTFWEPINDDGERLEWRHDAVNIHRNGVAGADHLRAQMAAAGIEMQVVHASVAPRQGFIVSNEEVAHLVSTNPQWIVGVGAVDPTDPDAPEHARDAVERLGLRGIVVPLARAHVRPDDPRLTPIVAVCEDRGVPLIVPAGTSWEPDSLALYTRPADFEPLVHAHPGLRLWLTQWAWPWMTELAMLLQKYPNVVTDTGMLYFDSAYEWYEHCFTRAIPATWIDRAVRHQVLFASGNPRFEQIRMTHALRELPLRPSTLELVLRDNARCVLGLGNR